MIKESTVKLPRLKSTKFYTGQLDDMEFLDWPNSMLWAQRGLHCWLPVTRCCFIKLTMKSLGNSISNQIHSTRCKSLRHRKKFRLIRTINLSRYFIKLNHLKNNSCKPLACFKTATVVILECNR